MIRWVKGAKPGKASFSLVKSEVQVTLQSVPKNFSTTSPWGKSGPPNSLALPDFN
jgi:hypothetical protein